MDSSAANRPGEAKTTRGGTRRGSPAPVRAGDGGQRDVTHRPTSQRRDCHRSHHTGKESTESVGGEQGRAGGRLAAMTVRRLCWTLLTAGRVLGHREGTQGHPRPCAPTVQLTEEMPNARDELFFPSRTMLLPTLRHSLAHAYAMFFTNTARGAENNPVSEDAKRGH